MPTARHVQTSLTSGEFDPNLFGREDVTFFYSSARYIENIVPLPQGGGVRRDGWPFRSKVRGAMSGISTAAATITTPNGGTIANATDGSRTTLVTTTTAIGTTNPYVLIHFDFTAALASPAVAVDLKDLKFSALPTSTASQTLELQSSTDNASWSVRDSFSVGTTAYNRRFAVPPSSVMGTDRYWRVVRIGTLDLTTSVLEFSEVNFWTEDTATLTEFATFRMTIDLATEYGLILTGNNCDLFELSAGVWVGSVSMPYTAAQVREIKSNARLATMILYHADVAPFAIQNLGSDADWQGDDLAFDSVSEYEFADANVSGGVNEIQYLNTDQMASGDTYQFEYNGEKSPEKAWSTSTTANSANIKASLEALADITSLTVTFDAVGNYYIEFTGVDGERSWATLIVSLLISATGLATMSRTQTGRAPFDSLWSSSRGYPRCGTFYQGRHWMGGFKAAADVVVSSRAGSLFDFKQDSTPVASSPIVARADVDEQVTVLNLFAGRHLQIFTSSLEMYVPTEPITPDNIALKVTTRVGSQAETQPFDVQGGTFFIARNGRSVREFLFVDTQRSYQAQIVSRLSGHLVSSPRSMGLARNAGINQPDTVLLANTGVNSDGVTVPASLAVVDREQQVTAFARIKTSGTPKSFITSQAGAAFAVVERVINGVTWNYFEQFDDTYLLDCSVKVANPDIQDFTATAGQTVFTYTFPSPTGAVDLAVWTRLTTSDKWQRATTTLYAVDLVAKTVTFAMGRTVGDLIRLNARVGLVDLTTDGPHLNSSTVFVSGDGMPLGDYPVASNVINLGAKRLDFSAEVGFSQVPILILHPYKAAGAAVSPTMKRQRIFRSLMDWITTGSATIGFAGGTQSEVALPFSVEDSTLAILRDRTGSLILDRQILSLNARAGSDNVDTPLNELQFTGPIRESGIGSWQLDPRLKLSQSAPMAWHLRSLIYDVRY